VKLARALTEYLGHHPNCRSNTDRPSGLLDQLHPYRAQTQFSYLEMWYLRIFGRFEIARDYVIVRADEPSASAMEYLKIAQVKAQAN